jgi:predicted GTPase
MGYGAKQIKELEQTIDAVKCDLLVMGTPIDLRRVMTLSKPAVRVQYDIKETTKPTLDQILRSTPILARSR